MFRGRVRYTEADLRQRLHDTEMEINNLGVPSRVRFLLGAGESRKKWLARLWARCCPQVRRK